MYLAGGRKAFAGAGAGAVGTNRQLHAPARRLARTIISLGPQDGLAFGIHAIRAIEATAGAASGDMHRWAGDTGVGLGGAIMSWTALNLAMNC